MFIVLVLDNGAHSHLSFAMTAQIGLERLTGLVAFARAGSFGSYTAGRAIVVDLAIGRKQEHPAA